MSLESWTKKTEAFLEQKGRHGENRKEYDSSYGLFQNLEASACRLDDTVLRQLEEMRSGYQDSARELELERAMLTEERRELECAIQSELTALHEAKGKLEAASGGTYGQNVRDALRACERSILDYQSLLARIGADAQTEGGSVSAMREHIQTEQGFLSVLMAEADAVGILSRATPAQRAAVRAYTSEDGANSFHTTNPILRGKQPLETASKETLTTIRDLHSLLSNHTTRAPLTVYRGVNDHTAMVRAGDGTLGLDAFSDEALVGKLLVDGAFVSTSTTQSACRRERTLLVLNLPAGTYGAYVGDISSYSHMEREFLMDMNQAFRVRRVERRDGIRYIYADSLRRKGGG